MTQAANSPRILKWGSYDHQRREMDAVHVHCSGGITYFGNGADEVMAVAKASRKGGAFVHVYNKHTGNLMGGAFNYGDYFHLDPDGK